MSDDQSAWWKSDGGFFGDIYKEMDNSYEGHLNTSKPLNERTEEEIAGVMRLCGLQAGDKLLDCPCGYGRHSLALAKQGLDVTGADINKRFLELDAQAQQQNSDLKLKFTEADMRYLPFAAEYDAVINMFYSFGFFDTDEENVAVARKFYDVLKPGGRFLMHTHVTVPRLISGELKNKQVRQLQSGKKLDLERTYNAETKREDGVWRLLSETGELEETLTPYTVRLYTDTEWTELCKSVGFSDVKIYGDWDGTPYTDASPQFIAVATK